jgi:hypothetical protein
MISAFQTSKLFTKISFPNLNTPITYHKFPARIHLVMNDSILLRKIPLIDDAPNLLYVENLTPTNVTLEYQNPTMMVPKSVLLLPHVTVVISLSVLNVIQLRVISNLE